MWLLRDVSISLSSNNLLRKVSDLRGWSRRGTTHLVHVSDGWWGPGAAICGSPRREIFHKTSLDPAHARLRTLPPAQRPLRRLPHMGRCFHVRLLQQPFI
ncbi:hypothetical protein AVEN_22891-1 [Araneus ventricosus]|uniref:Uncharacterized protein n=1 Tax=Araneus ventricosus TaxID=182803 RepID=A0A4Y2TQU0_ARAVE|nr:hypothetical protein AVEN_91045-1 [Araneus ventricosus]GBO02622.1 hypothetical protein AVEN_22891-1 [Araneus ventricosus]